MTRPLIIGLYGAHPRCGKTTVARQLAALGYSRYALADPIKYAMRALLLALGYSGAQTEDWITGDARNERIPALGVTSRFLQQTFGTEWGRAHSKNLWLDFLRQTTANAVRTGTRIVIDDVRFSNEAAWIVANGGELWRLETDRPGEPTAPPNATAVRYDMEVLYNWAGIIVDKLVRFETGLADVRAIINAQETLPVLGNLMGMQSRITAWLHMVTTHCGPENTLGHVSNNGLRGPFAHTLCNNESTPLVELERQIHAALNAPAMPAKATNQTPTATHPTHTEA